MTWPATTAPAMASRSPSDQPNACSAGPTTSAASVTRPGDHHLGAGGQRVGDRAGPQVGVGRDDGRVGREHLAGVEVDELLPLRLQRRPAAA